MDPVLLEVRTFLKDNIDKHTKETSQKFFKEKVNAYGVKTSTVTKIAKKLYKNIQHLSKNDVLQLCEELFRSGVLEESFIACKWSEYLREYEEDDSDVLSDDNASDFVVTLSFQ